MKNSRLNNNNNNNSNNNNNNNNNNVLRIYSQVIGMEFDIEKCTILEMKCGKRLVTDGMKLPNQDKIRTIGEKETNKYLGILEADAI